MSPSWRVTDLKGKIKTNPPLDLHRLKEADINAY